MSATPDSDDRIAGSTVELAPGLRAVPIVHASVECTVIVRQIFLTAPPQMLALELPARVADPLREALAFADELPVLTLTGALRQSGEAVPLHFVLEPLEPLVEAARSACELGVGLQLIDFYQEYLPAFVGEEFPDTYVLTHMSLADLYVHYRDARQAGTFPVHDRTSEIDRLRELYMARRLRELRRVSQDVLLVCGMRHVFALEELLAVEDSVFQQRYEPELEALRGKILAYAAAPELVPESQAADDPEPLESLMRQHEHQRYRESGEVAANGEGGVEITTLDRNSGSVLMQPGYYNTAWLMARRSLAGVERFDRIKLQRSVYREAVQRFERETGELVPPQREKLFFRFARNWSIGLARILPDMYQLVMSARAFGKDDFARFMYELLAFLPPLSNPSAPPRELQLDDLFRDSRLLRFRLRPKWKERSRSGRLPRGLRKRLPRERYPGEWASQWREGGICSYPPEDLIIEDFGRYLQKQATAILQGREEQSVPFTASMLDGIDYRETIRSYHLGRIFVKDLRKRGIEAGSVVVIFSEEAADFSWRVVWWGEHNEESDMAFYATNPADRVVGPGICQSRYGGLMMSYPPGRLHDIWDDPEYGVLEKPADRLLAAAIEYNQRRAVVHIAARPPARRLVELAARFGQQVVHMPLSTLSPVMLARVQRFHVLDSQDRRGDAGDYIV